MADAALGGYGTATRQDDSRIAASDSGFRWNGIWFLLSWFAAAIVLGLIIEAILGGQVGQRPVWIYATIGVVCVAGIAVATGVIADWRAVVRKRDLMKLVEEVRRQVSRGL